MPEETITTTKPAPFIEAAGTTLTERLMPLLSPAQAMDTSAYAPTVAAQDPLQQQAYQQASGLGSFEPFLAQAGAEATGAAQYVGPQAYQEFMSPYQQEVIDTSLAALQRERDIARQQIGTSAAQLGAFGGGRQGLQEGAFDAETALGKAQLEAQLRQQGFQQAQQAAQQAAAQQLRQAQLTGQLGQTIGALGTQTAGLGQLGQQMGVQDVNTLLGIGGLQQGQSQREFDVARANALAEQALPYQQVGFMSDIFRGVPALQQTYSTTTSPGPSTSSQLLGLGIAGLGAYGMANRGSGNFFGMGAKN